jgi:hypothetical protein
MSDNTGEIQVLSQIEQHGLSQQCLVPTGLTLETVPSPCLCPGLKHSLLQSIRDHENRQDPQVQPTYQLLHLWVRILDL